jgi:uncharacterized membrane protein
MSATIPTVAPFAAPAAASIVAPVAVPRIASIDLMRGLVMIIMAIDHCRDFFGAAGYDPTDLSHASAGLFLTRWITHFCAPSFVFLAGTSAFLYARNTGATRGALQRFLLTRGLWLVFLELSWVNFCWRFNLGGFNLQVIWALGWCMVWLAALLYLPLRVMVGLGLLLVFGHNLLDRWHYADFASISPALGWLWAYVHELHVAPVAPGFVIALAYPLVPWVGVMALGYGFGQLLLLPAVERDRWMTRLGLAAIVLFLLLRLSNFYGEPQLWASNPRGTLYTVLGLLNETKYPPSLLFLLMTLGPVLLLLPLLERWKGAMAQRISVFGRVPMFFYLLHLPLIHGTALLAARYGQATVDADFVVGANLPAGYEPSLLRVYLVWAAVILVLYPVCRWYAGYKSRHKNYWWLSYL